MTNRQVAVISLGGALVVLLAMMYGLLTLRETCRDFNQATVNIDNKQYDVALAQREIEKTHGLIGCQAIPERSGMYFVYDQPVEATFWMKQMSIPIDIVWISRGRVIGIDKNLPPADKMAVDPPLYKPGQVVDGVLEIGAGKAKEYGIKEGSIVTLLTK